MKFFKKFSNSLVCSVCSLLIAIAPILVSETSCFFIWGEPDCPEALKENAI